MNETCDVCREYGLTTPAVGEAVFGRRWAFVCTAHAHRARSAGRTVIDLADGDVGCGGPSMLPLETDPQPSEVPC